MKSFFYAIVILSVCAACVTNKQIQYIQKGDVNAKDLNKDSLIREYNVADLQYKVQPEDIISIRVESLTPAEFDVYSALGQGVTSSTSVSGGVQAGQGNFLLVGELVDHHGEIPFILSGKIKVAGMTVYEIQDTLQAIANRSLKSPIVRARLLNYRFTVLGEVNKEGMITLANNRVSILEAIGLAGGLGELADRSNIKIIRQHDGKADVYYINLLDEKLFTSPLYYVQQGDIIVAPPLKQRTFRKYFVQNVALFLSSVSILLVVLTYSQN